MKCTFESKIQYLKTVKVGEMHEIIGYIQKLQNTFSVESQVKIKN